MIVVAILAALFVADAGPGPMTRVGSEPRKVDASETFVFGLRWGRAVVRKGFDRSVVTSFGQPAISPRHQTVVVANGEGDILGLRLSDGLVLWRKHYSLPFEASISLLSETDPDGNKYDRCPCFLLGKRSCYRYWSYSWRIHKRG